MKIPTRPIKRFEGSALLVTLLLALIVSGTLVSYLLLVQSENKEVVRSQAWNGALMVSEAGVEEALAFINEYEGSATPLSSWPSTAAQNGWTVNGNVYSKSNTVNANAGHYLVYVTNLNNSPAILSIGTGNWNLSPKDAPVRKIFVQTKLDMLIEGSLVALSTINLKGNNVMVDSFDSRDPLHSDWQTNCTYQGSNYGFYPFLDPVGKRQADAVVATDTNVINVGNAEIYGYVDTAPGGTVQIRNNGSVGDINWIGPNPSSPLNNGIQSGHARDDMNVIFPNVSLPSYTWAPVPSPNTKIGAITYQYVITQPGTYELASTLTANLYVASPGVTLYLPGGISLSGGGQLTVGTNADLTIYTGGSISTSGNAAINNVNQISLALSIYGLPPGVDTAGDNVSGCTSISVGGNGAGTGFVYAPQASLTFTGGGSGVYDIVGAYFVHDITLNGHFNFHYDKALYDRGPSRGFVAVSWKEIIGN